MSADFEPTEEIREGLPLHKWHFDRTKASNIQKTFNAETQTVTQRKTTNEKYMIQYKTMPTFETRSEQVDWTNTL
jgi:hypothetical protein